MKKILAIIIVILSTYNAHAQKKGYKEIQINTTLAAIKSLHKYKIFSDTTKNDSWIITGDSLKTFLMDIDHLEVTVDNNDIINRVTAYTKPIVLNDYNDWLYNLKFVINVVNSDVGKLNSDNVGRPSEDLWFPWSFTDTKTALFLVVPKIDKSATKFNSNYTFVWIEDKQNLADKKF